MSVPLPASAYSPEAYWDFSALLWLLHRPDDSRSQQICSLQVSGHFTLAHHHMESKLTDIQMQIDEHTYTNADR